MSMLANLQQYWPPLGWYRSLFWVVFVSIPPEIRVYRGALYRDGSRGEGDHWVSYSAQSSG